MAGFLLLVMGLVTWLVPNQVKQETFDFLNYAGLGYAFFGLLLILISIFLNKKIIQGKGNFVLRTLELIAFATIVTYSLYQRWYLPAAYSGAALIGIVLAYYWERSGHKNRLAMFSDAGVRISGLGSKSQMSWQDLNRIMLRHRILTVDCRDNKLFQLEIESLPAHFNPEDFEAYCHIQIEAKKHLHNKEW